MHEVNADEQGWEGQGKETESYHGFLCLVTFFANENSGELKTLEKDQQYNLTTKEKLWVTVLVCFIE